MATLICDRGIYCIRWIESGKRKSISLSSKKFSEGTAKELCRIVEQLLFQRENPTDVSDKKMKAMKSWIESAGLVIQQKLAKVNLIEKPEQHSLEELWTAFLSRKKDIKESTRNTYVYAEQRFFSFFDRKTDLKDLLPEHFDQWKAFLKTEYQSPVNGQPLVDATVAGTISKAKAIFNWAKSKKWVAKNPLDGIGRGSFVNEKNEQFITREEYRQLLEACPCQDWKVIIALARIGGLRCPSEVLRLRWSDINWEKSRFYVTSTKTERYKGKEGRDVPLWGLLRNELERLRTTQPEETEFVINRYRDPERTNLGTQFARIAKMAGIKPIKRPFDNLRASRANEIYATDGEICEAAWIGHSSKMAKKHYLRVQDSDFERTLVMNEQKAKTITRLENNFPTTGFDFPTSPILFPDQFFDLQGLEISGGESQQDKKESVATFCITTLCG